MALQSKQNKGKKVNKKKVRAVRKFITIVFIMVFSFLLLAGIGTATFLNKQYNKAKIYDPENPETWPENLPGASTSLFKAKRKTNVAVFGVDDDGMRTDVLIVASFDSKTKQFGLISIPRDTRIHITDELQQKMKADGRYIPKQGVCKINELHAYAGAKNANEYSVKQLETLLGIKIDYFVKMNFLGFRNIVDAIGGVDMYVPQNMDYEDPVQNLRIHLKKGQQKLDGDKAEQLVRFRGYKQGDVARVKMQQEFMKLFLQQAMNEKNILNAPTIITNLFKYVQTDFGINDTLKYVKYAKDLNMENVRMETLPGEGKYIGSVSYYIHDPEETAKIVREIFFDLSDKSKEKLSEDSTIDSKNVSIEVLNGSFVAGLAGKTKDNLVAQGYKVARVGNFSGDRIDTTRIIVKKQGMGKDLLAIFKDAVIQVEPAQIPDDIDIQIILGLQQ